MKRPDPKVGLVVRYDYLWHDEKMKGRQEGAKDRPCAIVQAVQQGQDGKPSVLLAPITHTPPNNKSEGVEIPYKVTQNLGLDDQRQWIKTTEVNRVAWDDAGITPAKKNQWEYGRLPKGLFDQTRQEMQQNARVRKVKQVKRDVDQQEALKPSQQQNQSRIRGQQRGEGEEL